MSREHDGRPVGCALVNVVDGDAELVALVTTYRGAGAGTALLDAVVERGPAGRVDAAVARHEQRQHRRDPPVPARGLGLGRLPPRRDHAAGGVKPEIPETGNHGIPIRHEIQFEAPL